MAHRLALKVLPDSELLAVWSDLVRHIVNNRFRQSAEEGQSVQLFSGMTHLALTVVLYTYRTRICSET